nr:MAG TPA: hypothetical protein [Caudoviricetes sp.]
MTNNILDNFKNRKMTTPVTTPFGALYETTWNK